MEQLRTELTNLRQENNRLEDLYQCSMNFAEELQREPIRTSSKEEAELDRLRGYIQELEEHIESENRSKEVFMDEIAGYKMNFKSLEE